MLHDRSTFDEHIQTLLDKISKESQLPKKTDLTITSIKCLIDGLIIHNYMLEDNTL